jgi:hypothetical protein
VSALEVGDGWTGFRRLKRLTRLKGYIDRVAIDVRYVPTENGSPLNVYGEYVLTIWRPSAVISNGS